MAGIKLGLCIGINDYPGSGADLTGCVNDAHAWAAELEHRGFSVQTLTDSAVTLRILRDFIGALVDAVRWGDIGVVTFSGHGTWVPDFSGDEADGRDEALVPYDYAENGCLTDDDLLEMFAERRHGGRLVMISDSCHSGTVNRFAPALTADRPRVRFLPPGAHLLNSELPRAHAVANFPTRGKPRPSALLMSGCADGEYSYDGYGGEQMGAFSAVALHTLRQLPEGATYRTWHREIRRLLPAMDLPQTPQLSGTRTQLDWPVFEPIRDQD